MNATPSWFGPSAVCTATIPDLDHVPATTSQRELVADTATTNALSPHAAAHPPESRLDETPPACAGG